MFSYRHVKTSSKDFLEVRENNKSLYRLNKTVEVNAVVALIQTNDVLVAYSLEDAIRVTPDQYTVVADHVRKCAEQLPNGKLVIMGQMWMAMSGVNVGIANVTIGVMDSGTFHFTDSGLAKLELRNPNTRTLERLIAKPFREEIERWRSSDTNPYLTACT